MFACSACVGLGQGLLHPMANAFICQGWEDDAERSRALGFKQAFNFIGEALVALCVGFLALSHWGNAFLVYLGVVPVFLFAHCVLPKGELDKRLVDREHRAAGLKELFRPKTVYPVAYTHLYVYKRQGLSRTQAAPAGSAGFVPAALPRSTLPSPAGARPFCKV